jgi:hypothetical protein
MKPNFYELDITINVIFKDYGQFTFIFRRFYSLGDFHTFRRSLIFFLRNIYFSAFNNIHNTIFLIQILNNVTICYILNL